MDIRKQDLSSNRIMEKIMKSKILLFIYNIPLIRWSNEVDNKDGGCSTHVEAECISSFGWKA
jgi:hypothetical protein